MRRRFILITSLLMLLFCLPTIRFNQIEVKAPNGYPVHDLDTGLNYTTIQEAISAPETLNGHVVLVDAGIYPEHVTITKSISLFGEDKDVTIVDGGGTGTVIEIGASNVSIVNFTIRNAGKIWFGAGYPDSCVRGSGVTHFHIENSILADAAVCAWFYSSSFVNVSNNVVSNATSAGIIGYASSNVTMRQNLVYNCGLVGLHLDGNSINCKIANNTVTNCLEGIELALSAENFVEGNRLVGNNVSMVLNRCSGLNVFRENNMTSSWYNVIVWGLALDAFMQDFDTTNIVNGKPVYYFIDSQNLLVNPSNYPNIGYLAIANCTNITISDIDLSLNRDGLLMAQSTNCSLVNITLSGNIGPLLYGGLTLFKSNDNLIVNNRISNNSVGACFYQSNGNAFYHNSFVNNTIEVISNFYSPFSPPSGSYSRNVWDDDYPSGGNYWSNYTGTDLYSGYYQNETTSDGMGDAPYTIDANNTDNYPLVGMFQSYDVTYFTLPLVAHSCSVTVISNSTVSNFASLIWIEHPEVIMIEFNVTGEEGTTGFCRVSFPTAMMNSTYHVFVNGTETSYNLLPCSNADYSYLYFTYTHSTEGVIIIPEFPSFLILPMLMVVTLPAVIVYRKKHAKISGSP